MTDDERFAIAALVLRASTELVEGIQQGLATQGFDDVRPAHGFAFARISMGDASMIDVARHLGITKQAASQLVEYLVQAGYVRRQEHPRDARSSLLVLTDRGWACTRAASEAAALTIRTWEGVLGPDAVRALGDTLAAVVSPGPLRPSW